jgi:hypothetical protein
MVACVFRIGLHAEIFHGFFCILYTSALGPSMFVHCCICSVALLTSSPMMWRKERLWNFIALQSVHLSNLVIPDVYKSVNPKLNWTEILYNATPIALSIKFDIS